MDQQQAIERIRSVPLFSGFGDKQLQRVAAIAKEVAFPAGKVIAKQGESGVGFHMIQDGRPWSPWTGWSTPRSEPARTSGRSR